MSGSNPIADSNPTRSASRSEVEKHVGNGRQTTDSVTRRLVYALALIPIVPATAIVGVNTIDIFFVIGTFDEFRWFHLLFSILWVGATVLIWRRIILWTLGRKWLTALVGMIPFVQVLYGQPLWNSPRAGCIDFRPDMLRVGQHEIGIGLWVWLAVWVWWGWEKTRMNDDNTQAQPGTVRMTPTAKRLVASIVTIPAVFGAFWIIYVALDDFTSLTEPWSLAMACTAVVAVALWVILWWRRVAWSGSVIINTVVATGACLALPLVLANLFEDSVTGLPLVILACLPVIGWGIWMALTCLLQLLLGEWRFRRLRGVFWGDFGWVRPKCSANIHRVWIIFSLTELPGHIYS